MRRTEWTTEEDEQILLDYAYANGGFISYRQQAEFINAKFHSGRPVRSASSVRRREAQLLSSNAGITDGSERSGEAFGA